MDTNTTLNSEQTVELFSRYVIPNYGRYPISLVRGSGSRVWDAEDNCYLDLFPGWGCNILGYCPEPVVRAVQDQVAKLIHVPNTWYTEPQGRFAEMLCTRSFGQAFFCNSGAESVEAAIKLARLHTPDDRFRIITFEDGFHGRTLGAVTATAQPKYHDGLGPLVAGFRYAPRDDLAAVESLIDDETCAIMIEPVQGEGGVNIPQDGYLQALRQLADDNDLLLIFDEVQTGMGRTGTWFGYQQFDVKPDIITLAKGIASGVAAGAIIADERVAPSLRPGMHASTFGGNPVAMAAGIATVQMIEDEGLLENCQRMSDLFRTQLESRVADLAIVREIRIQGLMIAIDLNIAATPAVGKCMERKVLVNATHDTVLRLLPAMNITAEDVEQGCEVIAEVLREMDQETE